MATHHCIAWPCPICHPCCPPPGYQGIWPGYATPIQAPPQGCICPPGAEKTCKGFGCPRRGIDTATSAGAAS